MTNCNPNKVPLKPSVNLHEIAARLPFKPHPEIVSLHAQLIDVNRNQILSSSLLSPSMPLLVL